MGCVKGEIGLQALYQELVIPLGLLLTRGRRSIDLTNLKRHLVHRLDREFSTWQISLESTQYSSQTAIATLAGSQ